MQLMKKLILMLIIFSPATGWSAGLHYALKIQVNTAENKITGTARLKSDAKRQIVLSVTNLYNLKVNDRTAAVDNDENIRLTIRNGKETIISYEARFTNNETGFIDKENVFLIGDWYPEPDVMAEYALSATLPIDFIATSEAEAMTVIEHGETKTFNFQFKHPLDALHLAASTRYVVKKERYNNIAIEAYFFNKDAELADTYIAYTKKYMKMYETMLIPYPYQRFAIVENIFPTGYSMPTFTLLGSKVVHLPFIVKTSLGHEILHQWFGNSVYIDFVHGNWAEGLTTYLADHLYASLENKDTAYRKQIMVDYNAYVNIDNAMPVSDFQISRNKAQRAIGYGKTAMLFHGLKKRYGEKTFFAALRHFIRQNSFIAASWHDIQRAFEKVTGDKLYTYFGLWLSRKDIPRLNVKDANLRVEQGQLKLNFTILQQIEAYPLTIPITLYTGSGKSRRLIEVKDSKENISLTLDELPVKVVMDENYSLMRQLSPEEIPPVLAAIMGKERLTVIVSAKQRAIYKPFVEALGIEDITYVSPESITFAHMKENSFLIAGYDHLLADSLFGKKDTPQEGIHLKVYKNPFNAEECIVLLYVKNIAEAKAVQQKISHYGKYTELAFSEGKNRQKSIAQMQDGISVLTRPATLALVPGKAATLDDILSGLKNSRIIFVGEQHDQFAHHINQLHIIKKLHESGCKLGVGMEMFQIPYQQTVNDYLSERIDESTFLQKSEYFSRWVYDYNLYKPVIDYIKQQNIPLVALNIGREITRKVAREGIQSLTDKEKKQLPSELDFSNDQYRQDLSNVFLFHKEQQKHGEFNYFLQAQTLWDEAMAESAHLFLENNPEHKLVILAGNGHVRHKYGIPARLYRRNQEPFTVVVQDEEIEDGIADYVLQTTKIEGRESPKLGVVVEEKDQYLIVMDVSSESPAKKAGLQKGDIIQQIAGHQIKSLADLKLALFYSKMGETLKFQVIRNDKTLDKEVELFSFKRISPHMSLQKHKGR